MVQLPVPVAMAGDKAPDSSSGQNTDASPSIKNLARLLSMLQSGAEDAPPAPHEHKFWKTQPVKQPGDKSELPMGAIEPNKPPESVRSEPYALPSDFEFVTVNMDRDEELKEVYDLLTHHYVEDGEATMRFKYTPDFLRWVLHHPNYNKAWHVGVRVKSSQKLVAFIAGIPQELRVRDTAFHVTEINFLCVHKRLRTKRMAPVLIKEITRRCNQSGIFQAIYTAGQVLPTPISCARYYHRTLRARKLVEIGFSSVPRGMTMEEHEARFALPSTTSVPGLREMQASDVPAVGRLLRRYMARFDMAPRFSDAEVRHMFVRAAPTTPAAQPVIWAYVVEAPNGSITDFFSFYNLPSSVLGNEKHDTLAAAYLFYYASDAAFDNEATPSTSDEASPYDIARREKPAWQCSDQSHLTAREAADEAHVQPWYTESLDCKKRLKARLCALMDDMLILARDQGFDVVNCLTGMDNALFTQELKFGPGDGFLRFYLFNWRVAPIAGGMGTRKDEEGLDPAAVDESAAVARPLPPTTYGSGNGIVMV